MLESPIFRAHVQVTFAPAKTRQILLVFSLVCVVVACVPPVRAQRIQYTLHVYSSVIQGLEVVVQSVVIGKGNPDALPQIVANVLHQRAQKVVHLIR